MSKFDTTMCKADIENSADNKTSRKQFSLMGTQTLRVTQKLRK